MKPATVVLRVELAGIEPLVWRRLRVMQRMTLKALHGVLQTAMGWQDCHLHEFRVKDLRIGMQEAEEFDEPASPLQDEREWTVAEVVASGVREFEYEYDFGDGWTHRLVFEPARSKVAGPAPLCLAGENACPPEDVGGPPGYALLLQALANTKHTQHAELLEWVGGVWDPRGFDLNAVNRALRGRKRR